MATYLILNLTVLGAVWLALGRTRFRHRRALLVTFAALTVLTLIFDNLLIWLGMYEYAPDKILGLRIGLAPVEDFMYPLLAATLVPAVWHKVGGRDAR